MRSTWLTCSLLALLATASPASGSAARLYELTIQTGMPHLEENLRYTTEHSQRCLTPGDLVSAFPMLQHPTLAGCKLREQRHDGDTIHQVLVCENTTGTTGTATWQLQENIIYGALDVKLGGKNMTFFQRITGKALGSC